MVNKWSTKIGAKEWAMAITVGKYHIENDIFKIK